MMLSSLSLLQSGHLEQLYHIFLYLKKHHNTGIVFVPTEPTIDGERFKKQDWRYFVYATDNTDLKEALPGNMPEPWGKGLTMRVYAGEDCARDLVKQRL